MIRRDESCLLMAQKSTAPESIPEWHEKVEVKEIVEAEEGVKGIEEETEV